MKYKRIVVAQSGGPTPVINDTLAGVIYEARKSGVEVVGMMNAVEGGGLNPEINGNLVNLNDVEPYYLRNLTGAYLKTCRLKLKPEKNDSELRTIVSNLEKKGIEALVYIGGNDSAEVVQAIGELGGKAIHVEKTIDNDLPGNDHTSGWGSATYTNTEMIRALIPDMSGFSPKVKKFNREMFSTAPVIVYQTQGRKSGWLAYGTAFAKMNHAGEVIKENSPDLFFIREIPFNKSDLLSKADDILRKKGFLFVVCSEDLVEADGRSFAEIYSPKKETDSFGHVQHGRAGAFSCCNHLAKIIKENLNVSVDSYSGYRSYHQVKETAINPQHIQRCLMKTKTDAMEAFNAGREAVRAFNEDNMNISIALSRINNCYDIRPKRIPLEIVAGKERAVDSEYLGGIEGPKQKFFEDFLPLLDNPLSFTHYVAPKYENFRFT